MNGLQCCKRFFIVAIICLVVLKTYSQTYIVTYEPVVTKPNEMKKADFTFNSEPVYYYPPKITIKLLFNDSMGFSAICEKNKTVISIFEKTGRKRIQSHCTLGIINQAVLYNVRYWPDVKKDFFVLDTIRPKEWQYDSSTVYSIFNYNCNVAYTVSAEGDTSFVYYTKELPGQFGPLYYRGLPGLILGTFEQRWGRSYVATNIEQTDYNMQLPPGKMILTRSAYDRRKNE